MTADWWPYTPCQCPKCRSRPLAEGTVCRDPECQPGSGIVSVSLADKILGPVVNVSTNRYCASCRRVVIVTSFRGADGRSWVHCCEADHVWNTFD